MLKTFALLAASGALTVPAPAAPTQEPAPPEWVRQPVIAFPLLAEALGFEGQVRLLCNVDPGAGTLSGCRPVSETPAGLGFGDAAIAGARRARLASAPPPEGAEGGSVGFTLRFRLSDESGSAPPSAAGRAPADRDLDRAKAALAQRPLPSNLFIPAEGVPARWRAAHDQVLQEFDRPAREVWALVLARSRSRTARERVLNAGPASVWPAHFSGLQDWGIEHPEAKSLRKEMIDRMRALVCAEIVCEP